MLRNLPSEERSFPRNLTLAFTLSLVAGSVNASGLLAAGAMTSHMTGNLTRIGEGVALGTVGAWDPARYILFFLGGASCAALSMTALLRRGIREPVPALLTVEAALLAVVAAAGWFATRPMLVTELLCLSMGWQNALITRISGAIVRTTHMTGATTDLGIELAHLALQRPRLPAGIGAAGLLQYVRRIPPDSDAARATMHVVAILCVLAGATIGPLLFVGYGYRAMFAPAAILLLLVAGDRAFPRASVAESSSSR